jgi:excisionase family DNA binding protein
MHLLTVTEAAELLHVHPETVRRQIWSRRLPAVRIGARVLVDEKDLQAFVKASKTRKARAVTTA